MDRPMNQTEALYELNELNSKISSFLKRSEANKYDDLSGIDFGKTPDDLFLKDEMRSIVSSLLDIEFSLKYLSRPIKYQGFLKKNNIGRYGLVVDGKEVHEYSCASPIEFFYHDPFYDCEKWEKSRIEASGDYYIVNHKDLILEGMAVRIR